MHIPLAKLTMTSLKESFCPVKKFTSCMIHPLPIQQFLVVASFILCLIQLSTLHQLKVYPFWMLLLLLMWFSTCRFNYILFNLFDDWHFPFFFFSNSTCDVVPIFCEFVTSLLCHSFVWVLYYLNDKIIIYMHAHTCISIHLFPILIILSIKFLKFPNLNFWSNQGFVPCIPLPYKAWARSHVIMQN